MKKTARAACRMVRVVLCAGCFAAARPVMAEPTAAPDLYSPPALDIAILESFDLPGDFEPPAGARRERIGFGRTTGVALDWTRELSPIYLVEEHKGILAGDPLQVGDVLLAVNGTALGMNPVRQFGQELNRGRNDTGLVWVTRWRRGAISRVMMDLDTRPLDLTRTGTPGNTRDWRLGPIGASGWCFHRRSGEGASADARQIIITAVDNDGPAADRLHVGDVILGADGRHFTWDARKALAGAIDEAEKEENGGALNLLVWRGDREIPVTLTLPVMGSYSPTTPFDCPKTGKIIDNAVAYMKANKDELLKPSREGWLIYINALGLLATGRDDVMPMLREFAHASLLKEGETLSVEKHVPMMCWWWSYKSLFLAEYYLRTGDEAVLPTLDEHATKIAMGQSGAGTWGHTYAARENTGYLHGHLGGYGAINQMGLTMMMVLPLAEKCGVRNSEVRDAIRRGDDFFSYFIGRGAIPYGDHGAQHDWFDDNGKSGAAAIYFDLVENRQGARFFSDMVLGSAPNGREEGHTGHFWSHLWGGMGAARGGDRSLQVFMQEMNPLFTLERQPNGRFAFQDNAGENGRHGDPKTRWDSTGARLLQLAIPRRTLYITGKETPRETHLTQSRIDQILRAGRLSGDRAARAGLSVAEILALLEDPMPPIRSIGARTLAEREINCVDQLIPMLDSDNRYARYGAAEALGNAGFASKAAADKLIGRMATDRDVTFQSYAIGALINRDARRGLLRVAKPAIPVLLEMATRHSPDDPRKVLQQQISLALFYRWAAQPRRGLLAEYGLEGVDRPLLVAAIREILTNENGGARSMVRWVYPELTEADLEQLWGDIYRATRHIAPSGIMFASDIRVHGLQLMADHRVKEGLDLAAWYIRYQKGHGNRQRVPHALDAILKYEAHAKRVIPELESHARWYEGPPENGRVKPNETAQAIREAIAKINAFDEPPGFELISIARHLE